MILENISKLCKEKGISIARLERECGLGNATIRGWVTSSPRVESISKVANILGCSIDDLLKEKEGGGDIECIEKGKGTKVASL